MDFRRSSEKKKTTKELLKEVSKCRPSELESLLMEIEMEIERSANKDTDLLMAKTITTSRLASRR